MRRPALRRALRGFGAGGAALGVALVLATSGCGGGELESHLSKGRSLFAHKHYEEAQLEGLYVLLREPENEEALSLVARSLLAQDRDGEAESYFHTLAEKSPLHAMEAAELYDTRAREDYTSGQKSRAARRWLIALRFEPMLDLGPYAFYMADRSYEERDWRQSAALYGRALSVYADSSAVKQSLYPYAVSLHKLERDQEAMDVLGPFITRYPRHRDRHEAIWLYQEILIDQARAANGRMDYDAAVEYLRRALRFDENPPMTAEALLELGGSYENLQDYDAAASCYRRVIDTSNTQTGRIYDTAIERLARMEKARLR
ncbi:MAG: tetratricopeptide repeat protein [Candidatus Krumholzibacteriia bacterium]|nr:tetratricopeptide repeat protein [Candidatus Latescibacterota bacterium]